MALQGSTERLALDMLRDSAGLLKLQQEQIDLLRELSDIGGSLDALTRAELDKARDRTLGLVARLEEVLP